ncbi:MAG: nitrogenase component 1 [Promethearchaeota archaeon]
MNDTINKCHDPYLRCAFYGAAQTVLGLSGCCTIAHSPQGCQMLVDTAFSWQDEDYTETVTLCTKLCEDEIVYGGEDLLARTILEAKSLNAPLIFVLSACGPEIVGDDIVRVCEEMQPKIKAQLIPIESAGFRGSQYEGVDIALDVLLKKLTIKDEKKIANSVCLIAPHANSNPTWVGDLAWTKQILTKMGARVVATLTHQTPLKELEKVATAETSLLLSHDAGQNAANYLKKEFGVEPLCCGLPLPIGFTNIKRWLRELGEVFAAEEWVENFVIEGEKMVIEQCRRKWFELYSFHLESVAIVADATIGIPLIRFITEELEMIPKFISLRSSSQEIQNILKTELGKLGLNPKIVYQADVYQTQKNLSEMKLEAVFGSEIEKYAIENLNIPLAFEIVAPITSFRITNREYFGYTGMLNLLEIIQNNYWDQYRSKSRRYKARW